MHNLAWVNDPARTVAELQAEAAARGLTTLGNRTQLRARIRAHIASHGAPPPPPPPPPPPTLPIIAPMTVPPPAAPPPGWHWEVRRSMFGGYRYVLISDTPPVARPPRQVPWDTIQFLAFWIGLALVALAVILLAGPPLVGWIGDRIDAFGNEEASPDGGDTGKDTGAKDDGDGTGDTTKNGDGTIDIGKLIVNNDGEYNNGLQPGEIRTVPAGYLIIGDAIVNNNPPDDKAETGQITILRKEAVVIAPSGASIVPFGPNLEQTILTQKAMMVISGCNGGCKSIDVREVR